MTMHWGILGCGYMASEYCKVLLAKGVTPRVFSRDLSSANVASFEQRFAGIGVREIAQITDPAGNWLVCTNIESHDELCRRLEGNVYCEKPYSHDPDYETDRNVSMLMNRRYYYWVDYIRKVIANDDIVKIVASIPERSVDALITQSIHVIDLLWYLAGPFQSATTLGGPLPTYILSTARDIPLVINMNYGAHENFSLRFYRADGVLYEARPLEAFTITEGMEVREPDDDLPVRSYRPVATALAYTPTPFKPGLGELVDDLLAGSDTRLPGLAEHRQVHAWMEGNML